MPAERSEQAPLGARNPEVQSLRRLARRRSARSEASRFVIDGPRLVLEAIEAGVPIDAVYVPIDAPVGDVADLLRRCRADGVVLRRLAAGVLEQVTSTQQPQPAIAVARVVPCTLADALTAPQDVAPFVLVLCDVADPGNSGTLLRVAEAAGASGVVVCGPAAVEVHNPKVVRASAGSLFRVPVAAVDDVDAVMKALGARGLRRLGTDVAGGEPYDTATLDGPVALVLGSEAHGLAPAVRDQLDGRLHIPMAGQVESLNVAIAGAVLAFEVANRRRRARSE
jgi:TrmH family RNA methyltransferase